jgi:hypothetical protein
LKVKKIYINENQAKSLMNFVREGKEEVTFNEFVVSVKQFLKDLLHKPKEAKPSELFSNNGIGKNELISKMKELGLVKSSERIDEIPIEEGGKKVAKRFVTYKIPKARFKDKVKQLYRDIFVEGNEPQMVTEDGEGGGGATSCGSVMQGGGSNPYAGQYDVPFGQLQRRKFYSDTLKRNKDEKNGSISMNRMK